ncbi:MAG: phosphodiester glycosidase family protein [Pseudomonadota bacterium]
MKRVALAAGLALALGLATGHARALECTTETFEETRFDTCVVDSGSDELSLWWKGADDTPLQSLGALSDALAADGKTLLFAMNAGMYHPDRSPVGHLIIDGEEHRRVITSAGPGNFGMLPNGVLCWGNGRAQIVESRAYAEDPPACRFATQSGPMLVIGGKLHPRFLPDSDSRRIRNGAGVLADQSTLVFALSRTPVTFHHFARFMRDHMNTRAALYLDGTISRMYAPTLGRRDRGGRFGPILGVVAPD